jgi:S-methylmethionine-dependent homocysteine/selenocysteine methylase
MTKYRNDLPQLGKKLFLSDSGLETTLVFLEGQDLPYFAAFTMMETAEGRAVLRRYFDRHVAIARQKEMGFILDTPTWRANADWGRKLGLSDTDLDRINRESVAFLESIRGEMESPAMPMVINGVIGPRGDGYNPGFIMTEAEAEDYHAVQIKSFAGTAADMVSAITMTNVNEAIGIARAARAAGMPAVISFTVETDGNLPTGQSLAAAIMATDAATGQAPAYYMVNCAHPSHFQDKLETNAGWMRRIRGIRANASRKSHAELDESTELDFGNPAELALEYAGIRAIHPQVTVLGGCCGTDHRHIEQISAKAKQAA